MGKPLTITSTGSGLRAVLAKCRDGFFQRLLWCWKAHPAPWPKSLRWTWPRKKPGPWAVADLRVVTLSDDPG